MWQQVVMWIVLNHLSEDWHNVENGAAVHKSASQKVQVSAAPFVVKGLVAPSVVKGVAISVASSSTTKET